MTQETPFEAVPDGAIPGDADRACFERWRRSAIPLAATPPGSMMLAAYLDDRLGPDETEAVEAALAADPNLLDMLIDARQPVIPEIPSAALIARAQALVAPSTIRSLARRPAQVRGIRGWAAWSAIAASLILVSLAGFNMGSQTERAIKPASAHGPSNDLFDQSATGDGVG